jgi:hypothetical protein
MTEKRLQIMCRNNRWDISIELQRHILEVYGDEPDSYEWTEQDLFEQIRRFVVQGGQNAEICQKSSIRMLSDSG